MSLEASLRVLVLAGSVLLVPLYAAILLTFASKNADVNVSLVLNATFQGTARYKRGFRLLLVGLTMYTFSVPFRVVTPCQEASLVYTIVANVLIFSHGYAFFKAASMLYSERLNVRVKKAIVLASGITGIAAILAGFMSAGPMPVDMARDLLGITWISWLLPLPAGILALVNLWMVSKLDDNTLLSMIFTNLRLARISFMFVISYVILVAIAVFMNHAGGLFPLYIVLVSTTLPLLYGSTIGLHLLLSPSARPVPSSRARTPDDVNKRAAGNP